MAPPLLIYALEGAKWSPSLPGRFNPEGTYLIGGWIDPKDCVEAVEKRKIYDLALSGTPAVWLIA
jgi:hypothetical protein